MIFTKIFKNQRASAIRHHEKNMLSLLEKNSNHKLLDVGCDNGEWTLKVANNIGTKHIYGIELIEAAISKAKEKGIIVKKGDLSDKFPFDHNFFDVVHANMLIEHLYKTEHFVKELYRVLKPGGYCVMGTDNLASWHNIFSLIFGWMPMASTNYSQVKMAIGNPLAPNVDAKMPYPETWQHIRVLSKRGIKDIFELHGFKQERYLGSGYYPFPTFFAQIDPTHSAFMAVKFRKK